MTARGELTRLEAPAAESASSRFTPTHGGVVSWLVRALVYALALTAINLWVVSLPHIDVGGALLLAVPAVGFAYCVRCCLALLTRESSQPRQTA